MKWSTSKISDQALQSPNNRRTASPMKSKISTKDPKALQLIKLIMI